MTDLFGVQFYPTPVPLIQEMVQGVDLKNKRIIDPSAGRGDILDYVSGRVTDDYYRRYRESELFAIEKDLALRAVLKDKGYTVVDSDFLRFDGRMYFHLFLMNPPFKDGAKHLLHAWKVSHGALIKCLLNAETLRYVHTAEREELKWTVEEYGEVKELGRPFLKADRPTDVEVVLVTLKDTRPRESFRMDFDPETIGADKFHLPEMDDRALASANIFENFEGSHRAAVQAFKDLLVARQRVAYYLKGLIPSHKDGPEIMSKAVAKAEPDSAYDEFLTTVTRLAWDNLFYKTKLSHVTTEKVRAEIEKLQADQGTMAFTAANMQELFDMLFLNREQIMINCVLDAFDHLTKYHKDNREKVEGWATNGAYLVGKRFILPGIGRYDPKWRSGTGLDYRNACDIDDLEKALCFITGKKFENIWHVRDVYNRENYWGEWKTSEFFRTKLYMRNTMHFEWRDDELRKQFNQVVAIHRWNQVPETVKDGYYGPKKPKTGKPKTNQRSFL